MTAFTKHLTGCTHSAEHPCREFIACVRDGARCEQSRDDAAALDTLRKELLFEEHQTPIVFIGMGTCGLANGARKVYDAFTAGLETQGVRADVIATGCGGYCSREVLVDIKLPHHPRVTYAEVTPRDVPVIIRKTLVEGCILEEKLLGLHDAPRSGRPPVFSPRSGHPSGKDCLRIAG